MYGGLSPDASGPVQVTFQSPVLVHSNLQTSVFAPFAPLARHHFPCRQEKPAAGSAS
jgi:hypothetical protein